MKKYIYEIESDIVRDISYVEAEFPQQACIRYRKWWKDEQSKEIPFSSITLVKRLGEVITNEENNF